MIKKNIGLILLVLIFSLSFVLMIFSAKMDSQTSDEAIHLLAGYTYLTQHDYRLDPEHPPLIKELSALPILFLKNVNLNLGNLWDRAGNFYYDSWQEARVLGIQFLYQSGNNPEQLLFWGRLMMIILTLVLGGFAFFWAKKLYGQKAGILAAFLVMFFPNILAHGRLINTDLGLTLFIFIAVYFWGEYLKKLNWQNLILAGLFSGLAMASKYTAIILFFILFILALVKIFQERKNYLKIIFGFIAILIMTYFVLWASYGFSIQAPPMISAGLSEKVNFEISNFDKFYRSFDVFSSDKINTVPPTYNGVYAFFRPVLVPDYFFKGFVFVATHALGGHGSFLLGHNSNIGWWYYFPMAILFKTPISIFILLALSIIYAKKLRVKDLPDDQASRFDEWLLILPPLIFLAFAMYSKADLGVRHILPIFPFIFVYIAKSINILDFTKSIWLKIIIIFSIVWYLASALISFPNYLAYFNEFAGGPKNGHKILTDSNLDWGQDIYRIKNYIADNNVNVSYLVYPWDGQLSLYYYDLNYPELKPENQNIKGNVIISATYYQTEAYKWLKPYPFEQITPGVFLVEIK